MQITKIILLLWEVTLKNKKTINRLKWTKIWRMLKLKARKANKNKFRTKMRNILMRRMKFNMRVELKEKNAMNAGIQLKTMKKNTKKSTNNKRDMN